jgi:hypothetical protein
VTSGRGRILSFGQLLEQGFDGEPLHACEVSVGDLVFEQVTRLLEQVDVGLVSGELDLVAHADELPRC